MSFTGPGNYTEIEEEIEVTFRNQKFTIKHRCYCNEKGEKFTTDRQDDDMMWAIFRAYWERRGFEHFYDIDGYREKQEPASEDLEQASKEWLRPQLDKSYSDYGERKMMELTHFDGYAMLDAVEFGAQWQKEQMMKDAVDAPVAATGMRAKSKGVTTYADIEIPTKERLNPRCDKVKVIIIKE